jgi:hypothetical protein
VILGFVVALPLGIRISSLGEAITEAGKHDGYSVELVRAMYKNDEARLLFPPSRETLTVVIRDSRSRIVRMEGDTQTSRESLQRRR